MNIRLLLGLSVCSFLNTLQVWILAASPRTARQKKTYNCYQTFTCSVVTVDAVVPGLSTIIISTNNTLDSASICQLPFTPQASRRTLKMAR